MNNDLLFDGKRFISSKRAAKLVGYANDYIGQLCRSGFLDCRMVGRSWYVSHDSITNHKKQNSKKFRKTKSKVEEIAVSPEIVNTAPENTVENHLPLPENQPSPFFESLPVENLTKESGSLQNSFDPEIEPRLAEIDLIKIPKVSYENDFRPHLPRLSKGHTTVSKPNIIHTYVSVLVSIFVIFGASFYWTSTLAPSVFDRVDTKISSTMGEINDQRANVIASISELWSLATSEMRNLALNIFKKNKMAAVPVSEDKRGIVVVPDGPDHLATVERVKKVFSDEVNVSVDEAGDSGVITPVFRTGGDTDDYAFIMVPIKETKQTR